MKHHVLRHTLTACTLMLCSHAVYGGVYKWVDEQGKVHFTDNPPDKANTEEVELRINTYTAVEIKPLIERLGKKDKVVMYSATWCRMCNKAKKYFRANNIPYVSYDVEKSRIGKMDFKLLRGKSVPIIIVGNKRMNGFTAAKFDRLYQDQMKQKEIEDHSGVNSG
jgi:glutaredoxin